jgi:hypothetical protein
MFSWICRLIPRSHPHAATIRLTSDGFAVIEHDGTPHQVAWASVKEIFAFKLDLFSCDTIRLGFRVCDDGTYWDVDENDMGYRELVAEIERRFEIVDKDWWTKVAYPAFATNRTTLWGEPWTHWTQP